MDKPEGRWRCGVKPETVLGSRAVHKHKGLPGILLDYYALGKAKEGSTEVHAHRGVPAFSVILEGAQEAEDGSGRRRRQLAKGHWI